MTSKHPDRARRRLRFAIRFMGLASLDVLLVLFVIKSPISGALALTVTIVLVFVLCVYAIWAWKNRHKVLFVKRTRVQEWPKASVIDWLAILSLLIPVALITQTLVGKSWDYADDRRGCLRQVGASGTTTLSITTDNVEVPRVTSTTILKIPSSQPFAQGLLTGAATPGYRAALGCLSLPEPREWEYRQSPPTVTAAAGTVQVVDTVEARLDQLAQFAEPYVGLWRLDLQHPDRHRWQVQLTDPAGLVSPKWEKVELKVPPGWRGELAALPQIADSTVATWIRPAHPVISNIYPDGRAIAVTFTSVRPYNLIEWISYSLCSLWVIAIGLRAVSRRHVRPRSLSTDRIREGVRRLPALRRKMLWRQAWSAMEVWWHRAWNAQSIGGWNKRIRALLWLTVLLPIIFVIDSLTSELGWLDPVEKIGGSYWVVETLCYVIYAALTALMGRISPTLAAVLFSIAAAMVVAQSGTGNPFPITVIAGMVSALTMAGFAGLLVKALQPNPVRTLWVSSIGLLWAGAVLVWYAATRITYSADQYPLADDGEIIRQMAWALAWFPWELMTVVDDFLWMAPVIALLAVVANWTKLRLTGRRRHIVIWLFAATTMPWEVYIAGVWLPISVLVSASVLSATLEVSRRFVRADIGSYGGYERARIRGPFPEVGRNAVRAGVLAACFGLVPAGWFAWNTLAARQWTITGEQSMSALWIPGIVSNEILVWFTAGFLLGLLWRRLPGTLSLWKALPLVGAYATGVLVQDGLNLITDQGDLSGAVQRSLFMWAVLTLTGFGLDLTVWRRHGSVPSLRVFYGSRDWVDSLPNLLPQLLAFAFVVYATISPDQGFIQLDPSQLMRR